LIDLGPTLLDLLGIPDTRPTQGDSFAHLLGAGTARKRWRNLAYSELFQDPLVDATLHPKKHSGAVVSSDWWYLSAPAGSAELYSALDDPRQRSDRARGEPLVAARLLADLTSHREATARFSVIPQPAVSLREEERERLRALGYLD
jgi:hypothetical protein